MSKLLDEMNALAAEISVCRDCMLHLTRDKSVPGEGNIRTKILFIGEGPGANENATGRPFVGNAGNFLNQLIGIAQLKRQDVFITNVVKCRPPSNRDPLPEELSACAKYLNRQIELINPLIIVTLGRFSMARYFPLQRISAIHGQGQWVNDRLVIPMFHPAAALHQPGLRSAIEHDFSLIPGYLEQAKERFEPKPVVEEKPAAAAPETPDPQEPEGGEAAQLSLF
ncbi:MAG: uracil-DNA glycosylase [Anaerolineaceae bacterium]|nr:uracil-DNA glycosylase [Anaerolineaceae bacterium]